MARPKTTSNPEAARKHLRRVRGRIAAIEYICSGTLHRRTKLCGKRNCACATDPAARHGPYYQWSRRKGGRQENAVIPQEAVAAFRKAVANYRELRRLLRTWEDESARLMLTEAATDKTTTREQSAT